MRIGLDHPVKHEKQSPLPRADMPADLLRALPLAIDRAELRGPFQPPPTLEELAHVAHHPTLGLLTSRDRLRTEEIFVNDKLERVATHLRTREASKLIGRNALSAMPHSKVTEALDEILGHPKTPFEMRCDARLRQWFHLMTLVSNESALKGSIGRLARSFRQNGPSRTIAYYRVTLNITRSKSILDALARLQSKAVAKL